MKIRVAHGDIVKQKSSVVVVNIFAGVSKPGGATGAVDRELDGTITELINDGEIKGEFGELTLIHTLGKMIPSRVLVAGLGEQSEFSTDRIRQVSAIICRHLSGLAIKDISTIVHGAGIGQIQAASATQSMIEGALLGSYRFDKYKSNRKDDTTISDITIIESDEEKIEDIRDGVNKGVIIADSTNLCRDMVNEPANVMTPSRMAEVAREVSTENGIELDILDLGAIRELGMGAFLGVAQGSREEPKLIVLKYNGDPEKPNHKLGFVGKGITFDSGGISIKPAPNMGAMKGDMAGGAAVIAAIKAISQLGLKINVVSLVPATENMPGGHAQRPGDIVRTMSGKTIEIDNTDAEGRLVLADTISYARSLEIEPIIDIATLTGAMVIALGNICTGIFGNDEDLTRSISEASATTGEPMWEMPTYSEYGNQYQSDVADFKNTGGRAAGSITGAKLIEEFTTGASWAHLDIAGTSKTDKIGGYNVKGGTGVPVRTLIQLAIQLSSN